MNKTIIINITGVIFHIEEDAYQLLRTYMDDIKRHFASYKDSFEIVGDIESRVAEMFSEQLLAGKKQVVVMADVNEVTARMGKATDFETEEDENEYANSHEPKSPTKKLFRDTEDRFIGGVCSGIGHYFGIEAKWVRVSFIVLLTPGGFGLLPYVLLWIVMPRAITRTEKMEMKGEPINLQTFQKNIEVELDAVKANLKKVTENAPTFQKVSAFIRDILAGILSFLGLTAKALIKIFAVLIIVVVGVLFIVAFGFLMMFLGYTGNADVATIFPLNAVAASLRPVLIVCVFLAMVIPFLALLFLLLRLTFNKRTISKNVSLGLAVVWMIAVAIGIFCIGKNATEFKEEARYSETIELKTNISKTYILRLGDERTIKEAIPNNTIGTSVITIAGSNQDFEMPNDLSFELKVSDGSAPILSKTYVARGRNFDQALKNAKQIAYYYHQQDSVFTFDYQYGLIGASLWRGQEVELMLKIPVNSTLMVEKRLAETLFRYELDDCFEEEINDSALIKVQATKEGFVCEKTAEAIERQKKYNQKYNIDEQVSNTVLF